MLAEVLLIKISKQLITPIAYFVESILLAIGRCIVSQKINVYR